MGYHDFVWRLSGPSGACGAASDGRRKLENYVVIDTHTRDLFLRRMFSLQQADKLMVSTALILLAGRYGKVTAIPAAIILSRELAVSALREWMASHRLRDVVKVGFQGKVKTALTMLTLTLLLLVPESGVGVLGGLLIPSHVLLYVCAAITVTSGSVYFKAAAPNLMKR